MFFKAAARKGDRGLIDLRLFRGKTFAAAAVTQFMSNGISFAGQTLIPLYLIRACGRSPSATGWLLAPQNCSAVLSIESGSRRDAANRRAWSTQSRTKAAANALERETGECANSNLHPRKAAQSEPAMLFQFPNRNAQRGLRQMDALGGAIEVSVRQRRHAVTHKGKRSINVSLVESGIDLSDETLHLRHSFPPRRCAFTYPRSSVLVRFVLSASSASRASMVGRLPSSCSGSCSRW